MASKTSTAERTTGYHKKIRKSTGEKIFIVCNAIFMIIVCFITVYPFINTLAYSLNDGMDAARGGIYFWPRSFSWINYETVFQDDEILGAYGITIARTVLGTITTLFFTGMFAYGLSKKYLVGRTVYMKICVVCMLFGAGLIPTYIWYMEIGLLNNFLVYILPGAISIWYMILMKTNFEQIPAELEESAQLDGASTMTIFLRIILPVSMPIVATICIFAAVDQWNAWFDAYMYAPRNPSIHPIQTYLYKVIALSQAQSQDAAQADAIERMRTNVTTIRAATVMVTTIPILCIYSMFQKHFTKGVMVGALKG